MTFNWCFELPGTFSFIVVLYKVLIYYKKDEEESSSISTRKQNQTDSKDRMGLMPCLIALGLPEKARDCEAQAFLGTTISSDVWYISRKGWGMRAIKKSRVKQWES